MKHYKDFGVKPNNDTEGFIKVLHTLERVFDANVHDIDDFNTFHALHHVDYAWLVNATYFLNPYLQARYGFTYDVREGVSGASCSRCSIIFTPKGDN